MRVEVSRERSIGAWYRSLVGGGPTGALTAALVVGFVLRAAWCIWATRAPSTFFSDSSQYLRMAEGFANGHLPSIGPRHSAFFAPGYPMILAPLVFVSERLGGIMSPSTLASSFNVVVGTSTILGVAALARQWFPPPAPALAAWMLALMPGQIIMTSVALSETVFAAMLVWLVVAVTAVVRRQVQLRSFELVALGVAIGLAVLVRNVGLVLLAIPLVGLGGPNRRALARQCALLAIGVLIVLVPWAVRNGLQVGVWSPLFTGGASSLCLAHTEGATGGSDVGADVYARCFEGSPMAEPSLYRRADAPAVVIPADAAPIDEPAWFRSTTASALKWIRRNPGETVRLAGVEAWITMSSDSDALAAAEDFGRSPLTSPVREPLDRFATYSFLLLLSVASVSLVAFRACRRAWPLWFVPAALLLTSLPGIALNRYHHPMVPLLAAMAAGGLIWSARPRVRRQRRSGSVVERALFGLAGASFTAAFLFDVAAQFTAEPCSDFAAPARWLQGIGVLVAGAFTVLFVRRRGTLGRGERSFITSVVLLDVGLLSVALSWWSRSDLAGCLSAWSAAFSLSVIGLASWLAGSVGVLLVERGCMDGDGVDGSVPWFRQLARVVYELTSSGSLGAALLALAADVGSHVGLDPTMAPRAAFWLTAMSLAAVVVAVAAVAVGRLPCRGSSRRSLWPVMAAAVAGLLVSLWARTGSTYSDPVAPGPPVALLVACAALFAVSVISVRSGGARGIEPAAEASAADGLVGSDAG